MRELCERNRQTEDHDMMSSSCTSLDAPTVKEAIRIVAQGEAVFSIMADGRLFWREREVDTDDALRAALMELAWLLRWTTP